MRDDLGIGIGDELVAGELELAPHAVMVLDDAVVHHRYAPRDVRVGVLHRGDAVRCPAGVRDADVARQAVPVREARQLGDAPGAAQPLHAAVDYGDAGGIVAAVLEPPQPLEQDGDDVTAGNCSHYAAHGCPLRVVLPGPRSLSASRPIVAAAAQVSARKSIASAVRPGTAAWWSSSRRPRATTMKSSATRIRPAAAIHRSAAMAEYTAKCASLSQGATIRPAAAGRTLIVKSSKTMAAATARHRQRATTTRGKESVGIVVMLQDHQHGLRDDLQIEHQGPVPQVGEVVFDARGHLLDRVGLSTQPVHLGP